MNSKFDFFKKERYLKIFSSLGIGFNIYAFIFIISYYFSTALRISFDGFFTFLFLTSWIYNIFITFFIGVNSDRYYIWKLSEIYLILTIFSPLFMLLGNFLISTSYFTLEISLFSILSNFGLFSLTICGLLTNFFLMLSVFRFKELKVRKIESKRRSKRRSITCKVFLVIGFLYAISLIGGSSNYAAAILAVASQVSLGLFFTFTCILLLLIKTKPGKINIIIFSGIGIFIISTCLLPVMSINPYLTRAETEFSNAFGSNWEEKVDDIRAFLLEKPYSYSKYFLGEFPRNCKIIKDVLYYDGEGIKLFFDAYLPPSDNLPGNNSVLITIHGGGWSSSDKGFTNKIQNNKYFASLGYVVFDIQYGLINSFSFGLITPDQVKGNFTIDDMVRQIGIFTRYLENHSLEYHANLDSVFMTGASSGGQLACAVAFAYKHPTYRSLFSQAIKIKGIIPLFPANGIATSVLNIPGSIDLVQPDLLINESSPPCLVFHGSSDGIVNPRISISLKSSYFLHNNTKIARILLPFAGHVFDYYFPGIYNQVCLYYIERFLYFFQ
jgi:acetyl esterase/lipase